MIGTNLDSVKDWVRGPFTNMIKSAREPGEYGRAESKAGSMGGVNGYPSGDFGQIIWTEGAYPANAEYLFTGEGNLTKLILPAGGTIVSLENNGGRFKAVLKSGGGSRFDIGMQGSGWSNFDLRRIEDRDEVGIFSPDFLKMCKTLKPRYFRFMDWAKANNNKKQTFEERITPLHMVWKEVPYEIQILLCILCECDAWINTPIAWGKADFDKLAALVKGLVDFKGIVYSEVSNEVWNGQFDQHLDNHKLAIVDPQYADETNIYYQARARYGHMAGLLCESMRLALGDSRVHGILAGHYVDMSKHRVALNWLKRNHPDLLAGIWGLAIAPYFGDSEYMDRNDLTVDSFFGPYSYVSKKSGATISGANYLLDKAQGTRLKNSDGGLTYAGQFIGDCKQWGKVPCAYEAAKDFGSTILMEPDPAAPGKMRQVKVDGKIVTPSQDAKIAAAKDVRIRQPIRVHYTNWKESGGGPFTVFLATNSQYGRFVWGSTWDMTVLDAPAFLEYGELIASEVETPMAKIDAVGVNLATGIRFPLSGVVDPKDFTIEFTCDQAVTQFQLQVFAGTQTNNAPLSAVVEKQKPFRLFGDTTPWGLGNGDFVVQAIAYNKATEVARVTFPITVGVDRVKELEEQLVLVTSDRDHLLKLKGTMDGQIHDLESELVAVRSSIDKLKFDIRKLVE